jgi:asparagine synthase (glutamine-hydrolysing)
MCSVLEHRGPDAQGLYEDPSVALGMRRLAIIDVQGGDQPVFDEERSIIAVFNGEIYNFRQLRDELRRMGHVLGGDSDSECIPHLYEEYGTDFVKHLRGMFTIALWDKKRGRLVLARDRLGKKPLYYRLDRDGIAFASELKALLADPATNRDVDEAAISHYLTFQYVPAPYSAIRSVAKLEPAHILVHERGKHVISKYWELEFRDQADMRRVDEADLAQQMRDRIIDCVKVRLVSDRPVGAFLSGGLDSSAVVAAMSRIAGPGIKTFSIGFDDEQYNELPFARRVAEMYHTEHHEMIVRPDVLDVLPKLARSFDEPYADSSAIPSYYLAQMASQHVVVALNGDGGDETLGGYSRYPKFLQFAPQDIPPIVARVLGWASNSMRPLGGRSDLLRRVSTMGARFAEGDPARRYARLVSYFDPEAKHAILERSFAERTSGEDSYEMVQKIWRAYSAADDVNRLLAVDTHTYLHGDLLSKVDITTMAASLEARSPFLDHTFVEWAALMPGHLKVRGATTKYLFKKALADWLPDDLVHRPKMGFGVPMANWLRGPMRDMMCDLLTDRTARSRGWFQPAAVDRLISAHLGGQNHSSRLYALIMLEMWQREVIDANAFAQ